MTRKKGIAFLCILALLSCSGCQIEKTEASGDGQKAGVYKAGSRSEVDYEELSEALLGMTLEECKKAGGTMKEEKGWDDMGECTVERYEFEDSSHSLTSLRTPDSPYGTASMGNYYYREDYVGAAYAGTFRDDSGSGDPQEFSPNQLRAQYPEEQIDGCSRDEAIEKCRGAADALGYGNAHVEAYAMTVDALNYMHKNVMDEVGSGRPSEDYYKTDPETGQEVVGDQKEWTKEYEAMMLTYYPLVGGTEVDGANFILGLTLIYAPKYDRIVYAKWMLPFQTEDLGTEETVISEEEAKETVRHEYGISDEKDMVIDGVQLVYAATYPETINDGNHRLVPAWRIDFHLTDSATYSGTYAYRTELVNGVSGKLCSFEAEGVQK